MTRRFLLFTLVLGFCAIECTPCQAQTIYYNTSNIDYDDYGQGYYGGFGRRTNSQFPGSYNAYGNSAYSDGPNSSRMFPRYRYGAYSNFRYGNSTSYYPAPNYGQTYSPYSYSPYSYNPYNGW